MSQELLREVSDPQAQAQGTHPADDALGIHYTSQLTDAPGAAPAESLAYVIGGSGRLYRFGDAVSADIDLTRARLVTPHPAH